MPSRRAFLATAAVAAPVRGESRAAVPAADESTWLTYAVNVEMFWKDLPFLERLKKVAEAGFTHYELWQFKAKDIPAIDKASRALNLTPVQFSAFCGITDLKRKEPFLQTVEDAIEVADIIGVKKICIVAGEVVKGMECEAISDAVVDPLKAAAEKVKDHDITIILEPLNVLVDHPTSSS